MAEDPASISVRKPAHRCHNRLMNCGCSRRQAAGFTLIELLCVMTIIAILASLLLGPVNRALHRARAMRWAQGAELLLESTVQELHRHFQGQQDFPPVTLTFLETSGLLEPRLIGFLKDRRVTYTPFAGTDPDDLVVIRVRIEAGFLTERGSLTATKGRITKPLG